jgi:hypothetical protein
VVTSSRVTPSTRCLVPVTSVYNVFMHFLSESVVLQSYMSGWLLVIFRQFCAEVFCSEIVNTVFFCAESNVPTVLSSRCPMTHVRFTFSCCCCRDNMLSADSLVLQLQHTLASEMHVLQVVYCSMCARQQRPASTESNYRFRINTICETVLHVSMTDLCY